MLSAKVDSMRQTHPYKSLLLVCRRILAGRNNRWGIKRPAASHSLGLRCSIAGGSNPSAPPFICVAKTHVLRLYWRRWNKSTFGDDDMGREIKTNIAAIILDRRLQSDAVTVGRWKRLKAKVVSTTIMVRFPPSLPHPATLWHI